MSRGEVGTHGDEPYGDGCIVTGSGVRITLYPDARCPAQLMTPVRRCNVVALLCVVLVAAQRIGSQQHGCLPASANSGMLMLMIRSKFVKTFGASSVSVRQFSFGRRGCKLRGTELQYAPRGSATPLSGAH